MLAGGYVPDMWRVEVKQYSSLVFMRKICHYQAMQNAQNLQDLQIQDLQSNIQGKGMRAKVNKSANQTVNQLTKIGALGLVSLTLAGGVASAQSTQSTQSVQSSVQPLKVVVSFQPIYDIAKRVGGKAAKVERMAPAGASPHHFDPTVRDIARIQSADVALLAGLGTDVWLAKYTKKAFGLGEHLSFKPIRQGGQVDPHWWLDASLMSKAALKMGEVFAEKQPKNAAVFRKNAKKEAAVLMKLHHELKKDLTTIRGEKIVTFHDAFGYFARAYGLEVAATIAPLHGLEPSAKSMARAIQTLRKSGAKAVFSEPQLPKAPAETVAKEAGVKLHVLDPAGSPEAPSYAAMMRFNRDMILKALK